MYLDQDGYERRFGADELADVLATDATLTFEQAVADAQAIVDSYLVAVPDRGFAVPLTGTIPARVTELTADLTRYELHAKKAPAEVAKRRDQAIEFLQAIARGEIALPELLPDGGAVSTAGTIEVFAEPRVFDSYSLRGYLG